MSYLCGSSTQIAVINQLYSGGYKEGGFKSGLSDSAKQPHRAWRRAGRAAGRPSAQLAVRSRRAPGAGPGWTRNSDGGRGGSLSSHCSGVNSGVQRGRDQMGSLGLGQAAAPCMAKGRASSWQTFSTTHGAVDACPRGRARMDT